MKEYKVKANDNLWSIAIAHGFKSEQDLLALQENKVLFSSTKRNEYRIYPGDIIYIPLKKEANYEVDANGKRVFRAPSRKGFVRFKPHDVEGNPFSKFRFEAEFQNITFKGDETTDNGDIEIELPRIEKDGKTQLISEYLKETKNKQISVDDKLSLTTIKMKLYTNSDAPDYYDDFIIHINFDPNDNKEGQLQKLSNEGLYNGYIPNVDYEKSLGRIDSSCYPDDVWPEHQLTSMDENGSNLLPIPAPINFQPQYYPVVWEMLRYERLFKISKNQVESLERELKSLKQNKQPYDATNSQYLQAEIDKEYYQYCFNYWFSEFSSLWHAHTTKDASADALIRLRSHVLVDEKLTEITEKWRSEFKTETIKDEILDKQYPENDVKYIPQIKDIFTTFYSTQQAKDKLTTKIVSPPLTSKVRFSYQDDPETPIANSYVLYWRYDKADTNKIETGREAFYNNARIMMPIGIGKTDKYGYLTQSLPLDDEEFGTYVKIDDGHFTMHAGLDSLKGLSHDYLQPFMARFESNADYQKYINSIKRLDGNWNDVFNEINNKSSFNNMRRAIPHIRKSYNKINNQESYDEQINALMAYADDNPYKYKLMRLSVANNQFNYYSSGNQDTWGFMVYPPDAGLIRTGDLAKIGNEGKYAYKGAINSTKKQGDFIQLPCTLQEWERRLKIQTDKLKMGIDQFQEHTKQHQSNIEALSRMDSLLNIYDKYPYEYEEKEKSTELERRELKTKVTKLSSAITKLMQQPDPQKDKPIDQALKIMDQASEKIIALLKNTDFADQLDLYQQAHANQEKNASPYMAFDETWTSIYTVIADTVGLLALCPKADEAYENLIQPVMNNLINSDVVTAALKEGLTDFKRISGDYTVDSIAVNQKDIKAEETLSQLIEVIDVVYSEKEKYENGGTVLDKVFASQFYADANSTRKELNKWVNSTPGTPSVLIALLEGYMTYIIADAQKHGGTNGYHIRLLMMISTGFGLFSGNNGASKAGILGVLKSNDVIRLGTKIQVQKGLLMQVDEALLDTEKAIKITENQIAEVEALLDKSKKSRRYQLDARLKRLKQFLKENELAHSVTKAEVDRLEKVQQKKQMGIVTDYDKQLKKENRTQTDEFYQRADGQLARVYKTTLVAINVVAVVEDWLKVSRQWKEQELGKVDMDIVMAHTLKTVCETAKTSASAILLANRWVGSDSKMFGNTSWLKNAADGLDQYANKAAVGVSILSMYIATRELYEAYNCTLLLEQVDQYLSIAADAMTLIGHLVLRLGSASLAFLPIIGQLLMVIGAVIFIAQVGYQQYRKWVAYNFVEKGPVGFYFWQEFKEVRDNSQRYSNNDHYISESESVVMAFDDLFNVADGKQLEVLEDHEGWGHLSWRAVVILYRQWRNLNVASSQLEKMIKEISQVPNITIDKQVIDRGTGSTTKLYKLISPMGMLNFYRYLERVVEANPHESYTFDCSGLSYRGVMNLMEQGLYIPKGEAEEVLEHIKADYIVKVSANGQASRHSVYEHRVVWDHDFFRLLPES